MTRLRVKKNYLITVAGVVWMLAGLNVAVLGVRAAIDMRGVAAIVLIAIAGGAVAVFCGFHPMFSRLVKKNSQRIADLDGERHNPFRFFDRKGYIMMAIMMLIVRILERIGPLSAGHPVLALARYVALMNREGA